MLLEYAKHFIRQLLALEETQTGDNGCQQTLHQTAHIRLMVRTVFYDSKEH